MVHKALNLLESPLPPLLVRRLVGLPFWLYSLSLTFRRLEAQDEGLKSVIHLDSGYCGSPKLAMARRQNHLVLAALLYSRASSSCHPVKLPVSPSMFLLSFSGVFYIRDLCISGKVFPCLRGM